MELNEQLRADQALIEDALTQYAEQWPSYGVLKDAMSYSLLSGGKRIRPVLTLAVCRLWMPFPLPADWRCCTPIL